MPGDKRIMRRSTIKIIFATLAVCFATGVGIGILIWTNSNRKATKNKENKLENVSVDTSGKSDGATDYYDENGINTRDEMISEFEGSAENA